MLGRLATRANREVLQRVCVPNVRPCRTPLATWPSSQIRALTVRQPAAAEQTRKDINEHAQVLKGFAQSLDFPRATHTFNELSSAGAALNDKHIVVHGYLGVRRDASKKLVFAELHSMSLDSTVQIISTLVKQKADGPEGTDAPHALLRSLREHTPVAVSATVKARQAPAGSDSREGVITSVELKLDSLVALNSFPEDILMTSDTAFPPHQRHLQLRNDTSTRKALAFRSKAAQIVRDELTSPRHEFVEIETPLLFKSTPEGAREFLVPTRTPGLAYALPQSPQQYKQILMASGIPRYMQFAKCFRDEDQRADRQPEFTQVDLEMAFAGGEEVMLTIEAVVKRLWRELLCSNDVPETFARLSYHDAMAKYGSDKPDVRLGAEIRRIEWMLPVDLVGKIGPLSDPIVEVMKLPISDNAETTRKFMNSVFDSPDFSSFMRNPDGQPGIFIYDTRKPLAGLQPFGFEAAEQTEDMLQLEDGDLVVIQARKNEAFSGGSTALGNLRIALHRAAVRQGLLPAPSGFEFRWIVDFPLFTPAEEGEAGQGGTAGLTATHHPFTSPKAPEDAANLLTDPLAVTADHYDLVVNGVELGGGSRRIHSAAMQELIMRDVLRMPSERIEDFRHLLECLRAGCPPHAGIALGFDRLIAVMLNKESVRDVIAFPKTGRGEDALVKSPSAMTEEMMKTYHLKIR